MIEELMKFNSSTLFILKPIVKEPMDVLLEHNLINSYLRDRDREDIEGDYLFVLFKPPDFDFFEIFLHEQHENVHFVDEYDYEGGYVVLVYRIPDAMKKDFALFKQGKYSKMSAWFKAYYSKDLIKKGRSISVEVDGMKIKKSIQWLVFDKDKQLQLLLEKYMGIRFDEIYQKKEDMELWTGVDEEKETLDIDRIRDEEKGRFQLPMKIYKTGK